MKYRVRFSDDPGSEEEVDFLGVDEQDVAADFDEQNHCPAISADGRDVTVIDEAGNETKWTVTAEVVWVAREKV